MEPVVITLAKNTGNAQAGAGSLLGTLLPLLIFGVALYFLIIRPQRKKTKEEKQMRENLQIGDEIITIGGIYGRVIALKEDTMVIESKSDHSKLTFGRWALQQNLTVHDDVPTANKKKK
ncbi:MAG: preprotein translocase subunit YajC [Clostridia bacterium]|nr:preprotein translocase subunit YajC [Clostridia bacterium]